MCSGRRSEHSNNKGTCLLDWRSIVAIGEGVGLVEWVVKKEKEEEKFGSNNRPVVPKGGHPALASK